MITTMGTVGVDFGGTWIRAAYVDASGAIGPIFRVPTDARRDGDTIIADLSALVERARAANPGRVETIGVAVPTTINERNCLDPSPNLPTISDRPLTEELTRKFDLPVWIENDARCFILGEWRYGLGRGGENLAGITLGTSVGLGIVVHGALLRGAHRQAGEIWRSPGQLDQIDTRENYYDVHSLLRAEALAELYRRHGGAEQPVQDISTAARGGDAAAQNACRDYGSILGRMLSWVSNIIDPEIIAVGGSGAQDFDLFEPGIHDFLQRPDIRIARSELGEEAAILGAAYGASKGGLH